MKDFIKVLFGAQKFSSPLWWCKSFSVFSPTSNNSIIWLLASLCEAKESLCYIPSIIVSVSVSILVSVGDQVNQCKQYPLLDTQLCILQTTAAVIILGTHTHSYNCSSCFTHVLDLYVMVDWLLLRQIYLFFMHLKEDSWYFYTKQYISIIATAAKHPCWLLCPWPILFDLLTSNTA